MKGWVVAHLLRMVISNLLYDSLSRIAVKCRILVRNIRKKLCPKLRMSALSGAASIYHFAHIMQ